MDSKYSINEGRKGGTLGKFNGYGVYKPLSLQFKKKKLIKKKLIQAGGGNGLVVNKNSSAIKSPSKTGGQSPTPSVWEQRSQLPVYKVRTRLIFEIKKNDSLVLLGETGSGKTTQIPQFIHECGSGILKGLKCAITQPRRMAAISIAQRVSLEQRSKLGETVG